MVDNYQHCDTLLLFMVCMSIDTFNAVGKFIRLDPQ